MSYTCFVFILLVGAVLSVLLASCKIFNRARLSWFAVPLPFFAAWVLVTCDWVCLVITLHE